MKFVVKLLGWCGLTFLLMWVYKNPHISEKAYQDSKLAIFSRYENALKENVCGSGGKPLVYSLVTPRGIGGVEGVLEASIHRTVQLTICYQNQGIPTYVRKMILRDSRFSKHVIEVSGGLISGHGPKVSANGVIRTRIQQSKVLDFIKGKALNFQVSAMLPGIGTLEGGSRMVNGHLVAAFTIEKTYHDQSYPPIIGRLRRGDWIEQGLCSKHAKRGVRRINAGSTYFEMSYCNEKKYGQEKQKYLQVRVQERSDSIKPIYSDLVWTSVDKDIKLRVRQGYNQICDHIDLKTPAAHYRVLTGSWVSGCVDQVDVSWSDPIFGGGFDVPVKVRYAGQPWRLSFGQETQSIFLP